MEADKVRLRRIDQLLWTRNYAALEVLTLQEMPRDLISEKCLDTARARAISLTRSTSCCDPTPFTG